MFAKNLSLLPVSNINIIHNDSNTTLKKFVNKQVEVPKNNEDNSETQSDASVKFVKEETLSKGKRTSENTLDELSTPLLGSLRKRQIKKPFKLYESLLENEEVKKVKRVKRRQQKAKDRLTIIEEDKKNSKVVEYLDTPTESYKWRDWFSLYNKELNSLNSEEFFMFLKTVYENHPECISFENGHAEIIMKAPEESRTGSKEKSNQMAKQNAVYKLFCAYIGQIKKIRNQR